jgi:hypothetical protein
MADDSDLNMRNNIRMRDTQLVRILRLIIMKNQMKWQSNAVDTGFTKNGHSSLLQMTWKNADIIFWPKACFKVFQSNLRENSLFCDFE